MTWQKAHPLLYHYMTAQGLKGIIESNSFWATYFGDLNDSKEIHALRVPLVEELARHLLPIVHDFRKTGLKETNLVSKLGGNINAAKYLARKWANALYSTTFEADENERQSLCCITSFCSHATDQAYEQDNGLLSQWRGYGKDGGFCIVLDTIEFEELLAVERKSYFLLHAELRPAHYIIDVAPPTQHFKELLKLSAGLVRNALLEDRELSAEETFRPFVTSATTFKHRGFYEEREVRLAVLSATIVADAKIRHLKGYKYEPLKETFQSGEGDFRRTHISIFGKDCPPLPIKRIIVGPSRDQEQNFELAKSMAGKQVSVTRSETPYVG